MHPAPFSCRATRQLSQGLHWGAREAAPISMPETESITPAQNMADLWVLLLTLLCLSPPHPNKSPNSGVTGTLVVCPSGVPKAAGSRGINSDLSQQGFIFSYNKQVRGSGVVLQPSDFRASTPETPSVCLMCVCLVDAMWLWQGPMSPMLSRQTKAGRGGGHAGFVHLLWIRTANTLQKAPAADSPEVQLARTGCMAAPSCKGVWETGTGPLRWARPSRGLSPWS